MDACKDNGCLVPEYKSEGHPALFGGMMSVYSVAMRRISGFGLSLKRFGL